MFKRAGVLFLYALTPLHPGSGASVAAVDLPVQRERHTNYPMIQGSGIKGALRNLAMWQGKDDDQIKVVFGPKTDLAADHGGALALTDARTLLFPVRSVKGVFAWITCPGVIARLKRDLEVLRANSDDTIDVLSEAEKLSLAPGQAIVPQESGVVVSADAENKYVILEDFCFLIQQNGVEVVANLATWLAENALPSGLNYWNTKLKRDLVLLSDDDFKEFVEMATEVITRIKLGEKRTVAEGPWDEEHLPSETLLYSLALATEPKTNSDSIRDAAGVLGFLEGLIGEKVMQLGGDETVGKGLVRVHYLDALGGHGGRGSAGNSRTVSARG